MSGFDYYKKVLTQDYANFSGRARRSEFWYFGLFNMIVAFVLAFLGGFLGGAGESLVPMIPYFLYAVAVLIPGLAVSVRRLHDTGKSGWYLLIALIPILGAIALLVFYCQDSQAGDNQWGPNPKTGSNDDHNINDCLLYTSPSPRDRTRSRMPSSA